MGENLKQALHLAGRGLRVFPLIENGATPVFDRFYDRASSDPDQLTEWFGEGGRYELCNLAVATGGDLIVFDADVKNGGKGLASLAQMELEGFDPSFTVETRSGGRHAYCTVDPAEGDIPGSVRALAGFPDIDVRAHHNYVVAPGSVIDGKGYRILDDVPPAPAPSWMVKLAKDAKVIRAKADAAPLIELDTEPSIQRATLYLKDDAPSAQEGAGGGDTTYMVAARVKDYGISEAMCFELMDHHWNEQKAFPIWMPDELENVIGNAYRYGTSSPGVRSAFAEFDAVEIEQPANDNVRRGRLYLVDFWDAVDKALADPAPHLIDGILEQNTFAVVYGPSNSGKTFLCTSLAYHIAAGLSWDGHEVDPGAVLYVAAEGGRGVNKRLAALNAHYKPATPPPLALVPCPIDLNKSDVDVKAIVAMAREYAASKGVPLRLIVIDTLSRALAGGDENSSVDMGNFIKNIDRLRSAADCTVLVVHHTGKNVANGARGWSGLRAAIDTEIEVEEGNLISVEKQRDLDKISPKGFKLETIVLGKTPKGKDITSCVLQIISAAEAEFNGRMSVPPAVQEYLDILDGLAEGGNAVSAKDWDAEYAAYLEEGGRPAVQDRTLKRYRKTLLESSRVARVDRTNFIVLDSDGAVADG